MSREPFPGALAVPAETPDVNGWPVKWMSLQDIRAMFGQPEFYHQREPVVVMRAPLSSNEFFATPGALASAQAKEGT